MEFTRSLSTTSVTTDLSGEGSSVWNDVPSTESSRASSPLPSDVTTIDNSSQTTGKSADGTTIVKVPTSSDAWDIRAHAEAAKKSLKKMLHEEQSSYKAMQQAQGKYDKAPIFSWMCKVIPVYNWTQRKELYNGVLKAQIKFNASKTLVGLKQAHVDYLDALSRSSLPPEQQHQKYKNFKAAFEKAEKASLIAAGSEGLSVQCTSKTAEHWASSDSNKRKLALQSEENLFRLLKEVQQPHTELRRNVDQVLRYREVELHHSVNNPNYTNNLQQEIKEIKEFVDAGGTTSLSEDEAKIFNDLFKNASKAYQTYQTEVQKFKNSFSKGGLPESLRKADEAFKKADAAVINEIRKLKSKKELLDHLKHKFFARLDDGKEIVNKFLESPQFKSLDPFSEEAKNLSKLLEDSNKKYQMWYQLDANANNLESAVKEKGAETVDEEASKKATEARNDANAAKTALDQADNEVIEVIRSILPKTLYATHDGTGDIVFEPPPKD